MYYRITKINVNQGHMNEVVNYLNSISNRLYELKGLHSINCVKIRETEAYAFSGYKTEEQLQEATVLQQELLGGMAKFFSAPPELLTGPQMWHWSRDEVTV